MQQHLLHGSIETEVVDNEKKIKDGVKYMKDYMEQVDKGLIRPSHVSMP